MTSNVRKRCCRGPGRLWKPLSALTVLFAQARDELLGRDHPHFLLLGGDGVEEVSQAGEQVLLLLLLGFVRQHVLPERPAEVEGLEHRVTVAGVSKLGGGGAEAHGRGNLLKRVLLN